jgi:hypothetical protein
VEVAEVGESMRRRGFFLCLAGGGVVALAGCNDEAARERVLVDSLKDHVLEVRNAYDSVASEIEDFDIKRWRNSLNEIQGAMKSLKKNIEDLQDALDPTNGAD